MKISIVMAYYNRKKQILRTLNTINNSSQINNVEVIIIDDGSSVYEQLSDIGNMFNFDIKYIYIPAEQRTWFNPCVPYNIGFSQAKGDIIIMQNPECLHYGDVIDNVSRFINDKNYIVYACYAINKENTDKLDNIKEWGPSYKNDILKTVTQFLKRPNDGAIDSNGWYNHSSLRNCALHFCSAITRKNLEKIKGFDERYSFGAEWDDNEILMRIRRLGLDVVVYNEDFPFVIHQWHETSRKTNKFYQLSKINRNLYENITSLEKTYSSPENKFYKG